jgi:hypothetical protein
MPTLYESGTSSRKARAAALAASKRFGATSFAAIERETSIVSTTVASSRVTSLTMCGRATPTTSSPSAATASAGGTCLRQPGPDGTRFGTSAGFANLAAARLRCRIVRT